MRLIAWYVRTLFCRHEWDFEEREYTKVAGAFTDMLSLTPNPDAGKVKREGPIVSATCSKCGWHRSYWKFGG